jgi:hypothetical protein
MYRRVAVRRSPGLLRMSSQVKNSEDRHSYLLLLHPLRRRRGTAVMAHFGHVISVEPFEEATQASGLRA